MTGFTDVFGGQTLQPANVGYLALSLSANTTLVWPPYATSSDTVAAGIMEVTPTGPGFTVTMPDATLVSPGQTVVWRNLGADSFTVADASGGVIAVIAAGAARLTWLQTNAVAAGTWAAILLGVGSSSPDASQLTGYGLRAIGATINLAPVVVTVSASAALASTDRGKVFVWTGGSGTLTLPALATASSLADWEVEFRNEGTGTLTIATTGGEQIDAAADITLNTTESCFTHSGPTAWYTVGRGRNASFNFTKLSKSVTGGSTTLSLTEAANVIQVYSGALTSNEIVTLPAVVQVYYITNSTTGAHTLTMKSPVTGGSTVAITQSASAVIYCDGTNIINCNTSGVTVNAVSLAAGTAGAPSLSFAGDATTGVYQPSSGQFAISISGTQRVLITSTGINNTAIGATTASTGAFTTVTATSVNKVALTAPATASTLTVADGKTLTASNTVTLAGTDGSTITFGTGGTVAYTANTLAVFAATTSAQLRGVISDETGTGVLVFADTPTLITPVLGTPTSGTLTNCTGLPVATGISGMAAGVATFLATPTSANLKTAVTDETGSGALVFATTPTLVTPVLGVATATSVNKVAFTAPATGSTLTIADGKTLTASNTLTLAGTDGSTVTFGAGGTVVYTGAVTTSGLTQATGKLLGRSTAATGAVEEITVGSGLALSGGSLSATSSGATSGASMAAQTAIANTETRLVAYTCAANELAAGTTFNIRAACNLSGALTQAPTVRVRVGVTTLTGNIAVSLTGLASPNNGSAHVFEGVVTVRSAGAGGTVLGSLSQTRLNGTTLEEAMSIPTATVAVNTTTANMLIELTFVSGNASNTYTFEEAFISKVVA